MDVYIEFTAARDRFVLVDDKNSSNLPAFPLVFHSVKEAVEYCKQVNWNLKDYGHFNLSQ